MDSHTYRLLSLYVWEFQDIASEGMNLILGVFCLSLHVNSWVSRWTVLYQDQGWTGTKSALDFLVQTGPLQSYTYAAPTRPVDVHINIQTLNNTTKPNNIPFYSAALNKINCLHTVYYLCIKDTGERCLLFITHSYGEIGRPTHSLMNEIVVKKGNLINQDSIWILLKFWNIAAAHPGGQAGPTGNIDEIFWVFAASVTTPPPRFLHHLFIFLSILYLTFVLCVFCKVVSVIMTAHQ